MDDPFDFSDEPKPTKAAPAKPAPAKKPAPASSDPFGDAFGGGDDDLFASGPAPAKVAAKPAPAAAKPAEKKPVIMGDDEDDLFSGAVSTTAKKIVSPKPSSAAPPPYTSTTTSITTAAKSPANNSLADAFGGGDDDLFSAAPAKKVEPAKLVPAASKVVGKSADPDDSPFMLPEKKVEAAKSPAKSPAAKSTDPFGADDDDDLLGLSGAKKVEAPAVKSPAKSPAKTPAKSVDAFGDDDDFLSVPAVKKVEAPKSPAKSPVAAPAPAPAPAPAKSPKGKAVADPFGGDDDDFLSVSVKKVEEPKSPAKSPIVSPKSPSGPAKKQSNALGLDDDFSLAPASPPAKKSSAASPLAKKSSAADKQKEEEEEREREREKEKEREEEEERERKEEAEREKKEKEEEEAEKKKEADDEEEEKKEEEDVDRLGEELLSAEAQRTGEVASSGPGTTTTVGGKEVKNGYHEWKTPAGDVYHGEFVKDKFHGQGKMTYEKENAVFEGTFAEGKRKRGKYISNKDKSEYEGEWKDEKFHGKGALKDSTGVYTGEFAKDEFSGQGTLEYAEDKEEARYEGEWKKGKKHGKGSLVWKSGAFTSFTGTFKDDEFEAGKLTYGDGAVYEGKFKKAKKHDKKASYRSSTGDKFEGEYADDLMKDGTLTYANGDVYVGGFKDGKRQGKAKMTLADGRTFAGEFNNDLPSKGTLKDPLGSYTGTFSKDQFMIRDGEGAYEFTNGDKFKGVFGGDVMVKGELKFADKRTYNGDFNPEGKFHGEGQLDWTGTGGERNGWKFAGEFSNGKMHKGLLQTSNNTTYNGGFDEEEKPDGEGSMKTLSLDYKGKFTSGTPGPGVVEFTNACTADPNNQQRLKYEGEVNTTFQPHGQGQMTWKSGDEYRGQFVDGVAQGEGTLVAKATSAIMSGQFEGGYFASGTIEYGEGDEAQNYEGAVNQEGRRHGKGKVLFKNGDTFEGEFEGGVETTGVFTHSNGTKFEGKFNVNGKKFFEGVLTFPDGNKYEHTSEHGDSFLSNLADLLKQVQGSSGGMIVQAETQLGGLGIWPSLPPVSDDARLPADFSAKLVEIQGKKGVKGVTDQLRAALDILTSSQESILKAKELVEEEEEVDEANRARFNEGWTLPPSSSLNQQFKSSITEDQKVLVSAQDALAKLSTDLEREEQGMAVLGEPVDTLEATLKDKETEDPTRVALSELLTTQSTLIAQRKELIIKLLGEAEALDVIPSLIEAKGALSASEAGKAEVERIQPTLDLIGANLREQEQLIANIVVAHETYSKGLPTVKSEALEAITSVGTKAFAAFDSLEQGVNEQATALHQSIAPRVKSLKAKVDEYCNDRVNASKKLATDLLLTQLHDAIRDGDKDRVEAILDDVKFKVDVDEKGSSQRTAVHLAILQGQADIIRLLHAKGASVNLRDSSEHSYLWIAIEQDKVECFKTLLECKADVNRAEDTKTGETLLHLMARNNQTEICKMLLENGAAPHISSMDGKSPLSLAVTAPGLETAHLLIESGASPNHRDKEGNCLLHLTSDLKMKCLLVEHGARFTVVNNKKAKCFDKDQEKDLKVAEKKWKGLPVVPLDKDEMNKGDLGWVPDEKFDACMACATKFSLMNRRHHCRRCGLLTCADCTTKKAGKNKSKICDGCYNKLCRQ